VDHTHIAPVQLAADQVLGVVLDAAGVAQQIGVGPECSQRSWICLDRGVGVEQQQVVGPAACELHQLAAVVGEVDPVVLVQLPRNTLERPANQVLRAVGGPGVTDHPVVDQLTTRVQAALEDVDLVPDDHAQAD
jgi:hypothetical protein